jgi:hypothetical protein
MPINGVVAVAAVNDDDDVADAEYDDADADTATDADDDVDRDVDSCEHIDSTFGDSDASQGLMSYLLQ